MVSDFFYYTSYAIRRGNLKGEKIGNSVNDSLVLRATYLFLITLPVKVADKIIYSICFDSENCIKIHDVP